MFKLATYSHTYIIQFYIDNYTEHSTLQIRSSIQVETMLQDIHKHGDGILVITQDQDVADI